MKFRFSLLKVIAWSVIGLWLTRGFIFRLFSIEFATIEIARTFRQIWIVLVPLAISILIYKSMNEKTSLWKKVFKLTLGTIFSMVIIIVLNFTSSICEWQFDYVRYVHKTEKKKIQNRFMDCGATTDEIPYKLVITQPLGNYLISYQRIELSEIDLTNWIKKSN